MLDDNILPSDIPMSNTAHKYIIYSHGKGVCLKRESINPDTRHAKATVPS